MTGVDRQRLARRRDAAQAKLANRWVVDRQQIDEDAVGVRCALGVAEPVAEAVGPMVVDHRCVDIAAIVIDDDAAVIGIADHGVDHR